jgi:uncharacterized protein (TIGR02996 family)
MITADAFLQAILDAPDDNAPRLIYADQLEERGDPRGEFIRVQVALFQNDPPAALRTKDNPGRPNPDCKNCDGGRRGYIMVLDDSTKVILPCIRCWDDLRLRKKELLQTGREQWSMSVAPAGCTWIEPYESMPNGGWKQHSNGFVGAVTFNFRRGFIEELQCWAGFWLRHDDFLIGAAPIRKVRLTTIPSVAEINDLVERKLLVRPPTIDWSMINTVPEILAAAYGDKIHFTLPSEVGAANIAVPYHGVMLTLD